MGFLDKIKQKTVGVTDRVINSTKRAVGSTQDGIRRALRRDQSKQVAQHDAHSSDSGDEDHQRHRRHSKPKSFKRPVGVTFACDLPSRRAVAVEADGLLSEESPPSSPREPITAADSLRMTGRVEQAVSNPTRHAEIVETSQDETNHPPSKQNRATTGRSKAAMNMPQTNHVSRGTSDLDRELEIAAAMIKRIDLKRGKTADVGHDGSSGLVQEPNPLLERTGPPRIEVEDCDGLDVVVDPSVPATSSAFLDMCIDDDNLSPGPHPRGGCFGRCCACFR